MHRIAPAKQRVSNRRLLPRTGLATTAGLAMALLGAAAAADDGLEHRLDQSDSGGILLGTSGSNINSRFGSGCCTATLGALVTNRADERFILSNNHVLADTNLAGPGEAIVHPGLIDRDPVCASNGGGQVARLASFVPISFEPGTVNEVDAAIAVVEDPAVSADILDIGPVSPEILEASPLLLVQKSGRTTGLTTGLVAAVDVTVDVGYRESCGSSTILVTRFVNQIRIVGDGGPFASGGDSGSLVVEVRVDGRKNSRPPRAMGLLFAGGGGSSFANPIGRVLACLGVGMPEGYGLVSPDLECLPVDDSVAEFGNTQERSGIDLDEESGIDLDEESGPSGQGPPGPSIESGIDLDEGRGPSGPPIESGIALDDGRVPSGQGPPGPPIESGIDLDEESGIDLDEESGPSGQGPPGPPTNLLFGLAMASWVKADHEVELFAHHAVVGTGIGVDDEGQPVIEVYLRELVGDAEHPIPSELEGIPVRVVVTGQILAE